MRVNKRFTSKNKHHHLPQFAPDSPVHTQCPILTTLIPDRFKNSNSLDLKHNPLHSSNQTFPYQKPLHPSITSTFNFSQQNQQAYKKQQPVTARKAKLQNLRQSIQGLQRLIQKSRQVLNESSFISNGSISPKARVKSDSFDVKFNFSTRKVNERNLQSKKINLLNAQSSEAQYLFRQSLLQESIQKAHQSRRNQLTLQLNDSMSINVQSPKGKRKTNQYKNIYLPSDQQMKTGNQLNSTLQKLLNQSFQSTGKGHTKWVSSPTTTVINQSPKWSKQDTRQLTTMNQNKRVNLFKKKGGGVNLNNHERSNQDTKQVSFDENHFPNTTCDQFYLSDQMNRNTHEKILIDQSDDFIENQDTSFVRQIQALTTKSRNNYQGQSPVQDSYMKPPQNISKPKLHLQNYQPILLKTPKAYKTYQQHKSAKKDCKMKDWIPKSFVQFENKVLNKKNTPNVFRETPNQGKFSPRIIPRGKQNRNRQASHSRQRQNGFQQRQKKKTFINDLYKYPFVQRYLKQADIVSIYDKLKKSKVPQQKWILFVIDEVHKRMKHQN